MRFVMVALSLLAWGCGGEDEFDCSQGDCCSTEWNCVNEVCECADGTACADAVDCDVVCEICE